MDQIIMKADGYSGSIELYQNKIKIVHLNGIKNVMFRGNFPPQDVFIRNISGMLLKPAGLQMGFLHFSFGGSREVVGNQMVALKDKNSIVFNKKQEPEFVKLKVKLEELMEAAHETPAVPVMISQLSPSDEILKFAELKNKGIITEEEFQAKKKQLLGL
jgi:hypothetical protein